MEKAVYVNRPKNFDPKIEVAACFCKVGDEILFLKRSIDKPYGGTWALPAGKLEKGEDAACAVIREVFEETNITLKEQYIDFLKTVYVRYPEYDFVYHMFKAELKEYPKELELNKVEHEELSWLTLEEGLALTLIPGEHECINLIFDKICE